jgi:2-polyprenyl-3-methyl-5-hydroxy-6-metoxy-1,4-benzoquinol methylase
MMQKYVPTDKHDYETYYSQPNNRIAGAQIEGKWGIDNRQTEIINIVGYKPSRIIDLACADGSLLIFLYTKGICSTGYGCDLWDEGITWAKKYTTGSKLYFTRSPIEDFECEHCDVAILGEVLEHVIDPVVCLKKAAALADRVIITVPTTPSIDHEGLEEHLRLYTYETLSEHLTLAGLTIRKHKTIASGPWGNLIVEAVHG